ncbi:MAG TPA: contractile injection system protein, VgrG/Pvc8 family [Rhodocyclaceae bacterium]|nr:contractile injection system protein, VgrG/Pvc8 family [Rhodocyclaceae bacterium]
MNDFLDPRVIQTAIAQVERPAVYLHCGITLADNRVLGAETFRLVHIQGQERISEPFEFQLELHGNTDYSQPPLRFDALMGRPVTFGVQLPQEGQTDADDRGWADKLFNRALGGEAVKELSLFNGIVGGLAMEQPGVYRITVKPALYRLTLTNHYRILSQMSVAKAIATVLAEHGVAYDMKSILADENLASSRVQDWFQAGESDFDFIRRLMGKAHLYYYFQHTGSSHTMTFSNQAKYLKVPLGRPLRYTYTAADELGLNQANILSQYSIRQNLISSGVKSVFAISEETWEEDTIPGYQTYADSTPGDIGTQPFRLFKLYQYGGSKLETHDHTLAASQALAATGLQFSGASTCPLFRAGYQFQVHEEMAAGTAPQPVCPGIDNQWFVLTQVQHDATLDGKYTNQFEATDAAALVTPFSIQETQQGAVLATVVGHDTDEPPKDWRYYPKTVFDLKQKPMDDKLSGQHPSLRALGVLVEFATDKGTGQQAWVKLAAHMQTVPEVGVTVVVTRANDESELPEIQSIVHNNGNKVVVPGGWTASTFVGNSYNTHYGDGKSVRYGWKSSVNLDEAVGIVTKAYDSSQYRDASYSKGGSYSYSTADQGKDGLLSRSESFGSTYSTHHGAMSQSTTVFDDTDSDSTVTGTAKSVSNHNIVKNTSTTNVQTSESTIGTTTSTDKIGSSTSTSTIGTSTSTHTIGQTTSTQTVGSSSSTSCTGSSSVVSMEGSSTTMSTTGTRSSTSLLGSGTDLSLIGSQSSISAVGARTSVDATGAATNTSLVGASTHTGMTGVSASMNLTGASTSMSLTGCAAGMNITGSTNDLSVIGSTNAIKVIGSSSEVSVVGSSTSVSMVGSSTSLSVHGPGVSISAAAPQAEIKLSMSGINIVATIEITL